MRSQLPALFHADTAHEVRALVSSGVPVDLRAKDTGHTPLHLSLSISAVNELIRLGADVSTRSFCGQDTPLHKQQTNALIVASLIRAHADVNALDNEGNTPLHMAFTPAVVFRLLKAGANPSIRNSKEELPEDHYGDYLSSRAMTRMVKEVRRHGRLLRGSWKDYYVGKIATNPRKNSRANQSIQPTPGERSPSNLHQPPGVG